MTFRKIQTTNLVSNETSFTDPILILNKDGTITTDVGFLGKTGTNTYTGLVRDSDTSKYILIDSINMSDQTANDISAVDASLSKATLEVDTLDADTITVNNLTGYVKYYEQASAPTGIPSGTLWKDTDTSVVYIAAVEEGVESWFEI